MADPHAQFTQIDAPRARVWAAWTDPELVVQWLAEGCDIDLEAGRYHLRSGTPAVSGEHGITVVEPGRELRLAWRFGDVATELGVRLDDRDGGTRMVQTFRRAGPIPAVDVGHLHELWCYNGSLLKTFLELGEAKCRLPSSRSPAPEIRHTMTLRATPAEVFATLVDPERIRAWNAWARAPRCDGRVGGRYSFGWDSEERQTDGPGEIVEWEADRKLTYRWFGDPPTLVRWTVEPVEGSQRATRLTLVHSGFGVDQNMLVDFNLGWGDFMANIAILVERGVPAGWSGVAA